MDRKRGELEEKNREPSVATNQACDPFLAALEAADWDDEPYTAEERAAAQEGWGAIMRGDVVSWEDVRHSFNRRGRRRRDLHTLSGGATSMET